MTTTAAPPPAAPPPAAPTDEAPAPAVVEPSRLDRAVDRVAAVAALLTVLLILADGAQPWRAMLGAVAMLFAPGLAVVPRRAGLETGTRVALAVVGSLVVEAVLALAGVWTGAWFPEVVGGIGLAAAAVALLWPDLRASLTPIGPRDVGPDPAAPARRPLPRPSRVGLWWAAAWLLAAALWVVAVITTDDLVTTDPDAIGTWGLIPVLPVTFYLAAAAAVVAIGVCLVLPRWPGHGVAAAWTGLLVLVLYGTAGLTDPTPRLPWVYKHIAVIRYLELHGAVNPDIDLYQRWPAFFAWAAQFGPVIGLPDPAAWANLVEPALALLGSALVLAIARRITPDPRFAWTAVVVFVVGNWVNQNYLSPQGFAYVLFLAVLWVVLTSLGGAPRAVATRVGHAVTRLLRAPAPARDDTAVEGARLPRGWAVGAVLLTFFVISAAHQLTPYLGLLMLGALMVLGWFRPAWVWPLLAAIAIGYLLPNLAYVQSHYGVSTGFDPVANATYSGLPGAFPPAQVWSGRVNYVITAIIYATAAVGLVRRVRAGRWASALLVAALMFAPVLLLAGQSYGGEGRLRVYLFSLPWAAMAAAWAFWPGRTDAGAPAAVGRWARTLVVGLVTGLTAMFTFAYFVGEQEARVPASEVAAAQWIDTTSRFGDVTFSAAQMFPLVLGPHYDDVVSGIDVPSYLPYYPQMITRNDLVGIAATRSEEPGKNVQIVFSAAQAAYDDRYHATRPGELDRLEAEVRGTPGDTLVYDRDGVRIYRLGGVS